jgi:hypothetical protein
MTLMEDKYLLHIIKEIINKVSLLKDFLDTYEYREIITSDMNDLYNCSKWRGMTVYHAYNTFNLGIF